MYLSSEKIKKRRTTYSESKSINHDQYAERIHRRQIDKGYITSPEMNDNNHKKRFKAHSNIDNALQNPLWSNTNNKEFTNVGDYSSTFKFKSKFSNNLKAIKNNPNIDVKVRKKVKTAGDNSNDSLFQNNFGYFNQFYDKSVNNFNLSNYTPLLINEKSNENAEFHNYTVDPITPTLPSLENQIDYREDQPMPLPIPKDSNFYSYDQSYKNPQLKAKSSCSLRKKSKDMENKNVFFTTDKNFVNIKEALNNRNTPSVKDIEFVAETDYNAKTKIIVASADNTIQTKSQSKKVVEDVRNILEALNQLKNCGKSIKEIKNEKYTHYSSEQSPIKDHSLVKRMNQTNYHPYHTKSK